jgi:ribosomal protein L40E
MSTSSAAAAASASTQGATTGAVQPGAVKPAAPAKAKAVKKTAPSRVINPGDKVCGQCGEGNDPARKFCRRCGTSLLEAVVFSLPWYKKVWRRLTGKKTRTAGARPKLRRRLIGGVGGGIIAAVLKVIVVLAILAVVVLSFVGPVHKHLRHDESDWYHNVVNIVHPSYSQFHPLSAEASSSLSGFPASNLINNANNTAWQSKEPGVGQNIILRFSSPENVAKIGFVSGDQVNGSTSYVTTARPEEIVITFHGSKGHSDTTKTLTLKDSTNFQTYTVSSKDSDGISIEIRSVYKASTTNDQGVSISQIELWTKK